MPHKKRVVIADSHRVFAGEVKELLTVAADIEAVDEAADREELLSMISRQHYDLLLVDICFGLGAGGVIAELKEISPELPILVLSLYHDESYAGYWLNSGAAGYLAKDAPLHEMIEAVQSTAQGKLYPGNARSADRPGSRSRAERQLSDRERQVMRLLAAGKDFKAIADEMMVGVKTAESYALLVLQKLELQSIEELTRYVIARELG